MMGNKNKLQVEQKPGNKESTGNDKLHFLVLHNDDIHTFEYVIECLMEVCKHDPVQAEQCTYLVHFKGSCDILKGSYRQLLPFMKDMAARDLTVTID